mgnify:CR=1 FL=1
MAATRLIALHVNKGKTVAQCLADRTDYSQNAAKTNDGEFISSYECDPKTADEEFLLSKRQYHVLRHIMVWPYKILTYSTESIPGHGKPQKTGDKPEKPAP